MSLWHPPKLSLLREPQMIDFATRLRGIFVRQKESVSTERKTHLSSRVSRCLSVWTVGLTTRLFRADSRQDCDPGYRSRIATGGRNENRQSGTVSRNDLMQRFSGSGAGFDWSRNRNATAASCRRLCSAAATAAGFFMGRRLLVSGRTPLQMASGLLDSAALCRSLLGSAAPRWREVLCGLLDREPRSSGTRPSLGP